MTRTMLAAGLAISLGACAAPRHAAQDRFTSLDAFADLSRNPPSAKTGPEPATRAAVTPIVTFPAWLGAVRSVREDATSDGLLQTIAIASPQRGQGADEVQVWVRTSHVALRETPLPKPTEAGIAAELAGQLPSIPMRVVTRPARNAHGPYGLAVGRRPEGGGCLYAWQWLTGPAAARLRPDAIDASIRVRLCRTRESLDALASAVDGLGAGQSRQGPLTTVEAPAPRKARRDRSRQEARTSRNPPALDARGHMYLAAPPPGPMFERSSIPSTSIGPAQWSGPSGVTPARSSELLADLPPEAFRGPAARAQPAVQPAAPISGP